MLTNNENNGFTQIKISGCMLSIELGSDKENLQVMIHSSNHIHIYKSEFKVQKQKE
jgi:hypothetical protein